MPPTPAQKAALERLRRVKDGESACIVYGEDDVIYAATLCERDEATLAELALSEHPADDDEPVSVEWATQMYGKPSRSSGDYYHKWDVNEAASFCFFRDVFAVTFFDDENSVDVPVTTRRQLRSLLSALQPESEAAK
jgi:hypothetical protein